MKRIFQYIKENKLLNYLILALLAALWCGAMVFLCEGISQGTFEIYLEFLESKNVVMILGNTALLVTLLAVGLTLLTRSLGAGLGIVGLILYVPNMINAFKLLFRGETFFPWDISLAGEVGNIMSDLKFEISGWMIAGGALLLLGIFGGILSDVFWLKKVRRPYIAELMAGVCILLLAVGSFGLFFNKDYLAKKEITVTNWNQVATYRRNGFFYSFVANLYRAKIAEPENYNAETVNKIIDEISESTEPTVENPNVIIVMSEAFMDIWNATNLQFSQEIAPNFKRLSEKYLSGRVMTSEFGGGTANSEFEVLTSYSTLQLPAGTIAYMNYVNRPTDSYVSFLNDRNYATVALHPYIRNYFSRDKAYEQLGFDAFYSEEHFDNAQRRRWANYISDHALTEKIIREFEINQTTENPFFCHAVSMQNHASYFGNELPERDLVEMSYQGDITEEEAAILRTYASLIHITDQALGELIDYFEQVEEPTVIVFFGDHQPSLVTAQDIFQRIGYATGSAEEQTFMRQSTPYLIWNNFEEQPTHAKADFSLFQLLPYATRQLQLPRPLYYEYMDGLYDVCKGAVRQIYLDEQAKPVAQLPENVQEKLQQYQILVYDGLLGKEYGSNRLH